MTSEHVGPKLAACDALHAMKYRAEGEDFREAMNRVASRLRDNDAHYKAFREILLDMRFMPGGRIQSAVGSLRGATPYNCYVSGTIADSFVEGDGSIMDRAKEAAATMRMGGGIGYDFSTLRPKGDLIKKLQSYTSGAVSFLSIYDAICRNVSSSGHRRGAQMGVLRIDHPDIEEFIHAKQNTTNLLGFNLSVAVTDEFMQALAAKAPFALRFGGRTYREVSSEALWDMLMRSTWDWAEPGVLFIDRINEMNNLAYCEKIAATNPCGEQPLPPFGACLLGSFNLVKYVSMGQYGDPHDGSYAFNFEQFTNDIGTVVRAMDNVIDVAIYPLREQEREAKAKRRMGLGVTGLANAIEAVIGRPCYGDPEFIEMQDQILETLRDEAYATSAELAQEKGPFPEYTASFLNSKFVQTLPTAIQVAIRKSGIRNSHLTSIAPTGTISFCADNVSSGIEPVFEYVTNRPVNTPDGMQTFEVPDYGNAVFGIEGRTSDQVTVDQHVAVLISAAQRVDSAVSKTCNVPADIPWQDFKNIYLKAFAGGAKGCTTFTKGGKRMALLTKAPEALKEGASCSVDPITGHRSCE